MDLNKLYKEIEEAEVSLNAKRLKYIKEALAENNGIIKLKFKEFHEFIERTGKEPEYVECQIAWKETGDDERVTIKLSLSINDDDNDNVFYYCNGIESFKQLAEYGMGEFIVTFCWSFF